MNKQHKQSNQSNKNKLIISIFIITMVIVEGVLAFYSRKISKTKTATPTWKTYDKRVDLITSDGRFINFNSSTGGILILPIGYKEKTKNITITVTDIRTNKTRNATVFKDIPEFTAIKFLPNAIYGSKLWITTFHKRSCISKAKSTNQQTCKFNLYEFDIDSGELTLKKENIVDGTTRGVYPLVHDPIKNIIWFATEHRENNYPFYDRQKHKTTKQKAYYTKFIKYFVNTNQTNASISISRKLSTNVGWGSWTPYGVGISGKASIADVDKHGNLFVITQCAYTYDFCKAHEKEQGIYVYRITPTGYGGYGADKVPLFTYGYEFSIFDNLQLTIDPTKQILYLATKSFDRTQGSMLFSYEINRGRTFQIGYQPTGYKDDVRGIDTINGKLLFGSFGGINIYDSDSDKWKVITTNNGIKSNNVELVKPIKNGGVCVTHENHGVSCLFENFQEYLNIIDK